MNTDNSSQRRRLSLLILLALMGIGALMRGANLGSLSLHGDEGYQALAVQGVLRHGYPLLDSGEVYPRAPLFIYLQAGLAHLHGAIDGWSLRLAAVVFGVLCIPAVAWLGWTLFDRRTGLALAAMLTFSTWHIEMSRYGRFYTVFMLLFVLGTTMFYRGFYRPRGSIAARCGYVAALVLAVSFHELGVMLGTLFLTVLPLRSFTARRKLVYLACGAAAAVWWNVSGKLQGSLFGSLAASFTPWEDPHATPDPTGLLASLPPISDLSAVYLRENLHKIHVMGIILPPAILAAIAAIVQGLRHKAWGRTGVVLGMLGGAIVHEMALTATLGGVYLACFVRSRQDLRAKPLRIGVIGSSVTLGLWLAFLLYTHIAEGWADALIRMMRFPDIGRYCLTWLLYGWPVLTAIACGGGALMLRRAAADDQSGRDKPYWFTLTALLVPTIMIGVLKWKFSESRYFLHLYPLLLLLCVFAALQLADAAARRTRLANPVAATLCILALLFIGQDTHPVGAATFAWHGYASTKNPYRSAMNWPPHADLHLDVASAADYVLDHRRPGDLIVCVGPPHTAALYQFHTGGLDAQINRFDNHTGLVRNPHDNIPREPVTFARVIGDLHHLDQLLAHAGDRTIWLLADHRAMQPGIRFLDEPLRQRLLAGLSQPIYEAPDHQTFVATLK